MFGVLLSLPHAYYCMFYFKKNFRIFLVGFWAWKPKNNNSKNIFLYSRVSMLAPEA